MVSRAGERASVEASVPVQAAGGGFPVVTVVGYYFGIPSGLTARIPE